MAQNRSHAAYTANLVTSGLTMAAPAIDETLSRAEQKKAKKKAAQQKKKAEKAEAKRGDDEQKRLRAELKKEVAREMNLPPPPQPQKLSRKTLKQHERETAAPAVDAAFYKGEDGILRDSQTNEKLWCWFFNEKHYCQEAKGCTKESCPREHRIVSKEVFTAAPRPAKKGRDGYSSAPSTKVSSKGGGKGGKGSKGKGKNKGKGKGGSDTASNATSTGTAKEVITVKVDGKSYQCYWNSAGTCKVPFSCPKFKADNECPDRENCKRGRHCTKATHDRIFKILNPNYQPKAPEGKAKSNAKAKPKGKSRKKGPKDESSSQGDF